MTKPDAIQVFDFGHCKVRTAGTFDAPLFCAADVCDVLAITDSAQACARLRQGDVQPVQHGIGRKPALYVTEAGLYKLVMRSRKPEAEAFVDWVTGDVLPELRKRGYYNALEVQQRRQTELLLGEIFPNLPSKAQPIFRDLIAALLRLRRESNRAGNPAWARSLASMVYGWALRVDGQQEYRRKKNPKPNGSSVDYSMFSEIADDAVKRVVHAGIDFTKISASWSDWKHKMELCFGKKALQMPLLVPMLDAPSNRKGLH